MKKILKFISVVFIACLANTIKAHQLVEIDLHSNTASIQGACKITDREIDCPGKDIVLLASQEPLISPRLQNLKKTVTANSILIKGLSSFSKLRVKAKNLEIAEDAIVYAGLLDLDLENFEISGQFLFDSIKLRRNLHDFRVHIGASVEGQTFKTTKSFQIDNFDIRGLANFTTLKIYFHKGVSISGELRAYNLLMESRIAEIFITETGSIYADSFSGYFQFGILDGNIFARENEINAQDKVQISGKIHSAEFTLFARGLLTSRQTSIISEQTRVCAGTAVDHGQWQSSSILGLNAQHLYASQSSAWQAESIGLRSKDAILENLVRCKNYHVKSDRLISTADSRQSFENVEITAKEMILNGIWTGNSAEIRGQKVFLGPHSLLNIAELGFVMNSLDADERAQVYGSESIEMDVVIGLFDLMERSRSQLISSISKAEKDGKINLEKRWQYNLLNKNYQDILQGKDLDIAVDQFNINQMSALLSVESEDSPPSDLSIKYLKKFFNTGMIDNWGQHSLHLLGTINSSYLRISGGGKATIGGEIRTKILESVSAELKILKNAKIEASERASLISHHSQIIEGLLKSKELDIKSVDGLVYIMPSSAVLGQEIAKIRAKNAIVSGTLASQGIIGVDADGVIVDSTGKVIAGQVLEINADLATSIEGQAKAKKTKVEAKKITVGASGQVVGQEGLGLTAQTTKIAGAAATDGILETSGEVFELGETGYLRAEVVLQDHDSAIVAGKTQANKVLAKLGDLTETQTAETSANSYQASVLGAARLSGTTTAKLIVVHAQELNVNAASYQLEEEGAELELFGERGTSGEVKVSSIAPAIVKIGERTKMPASATDGASSPDKELSKVTSIIADIENKGGITTFNSQTSTKVKSRNLKQENLQVLSSGSAELDTSGGETLSTGLSNVFGQADSNCDLSGHTGSFTVGQNPDSRAEDDATSSNSTAVSGRAKLEANQTGQVVGTSVVLESTWQPEGNGRLEYSFGTIDETSECTSTVDQLIYHNRGAANYLAKSRIAAQVLGLTGTYDSAAAQEFLGGRNEDGRIQAKYRALHTSEEIDLDALDVAWSCSLVAKAITIKSSIKADSLYFESEAGGIDFAPDTEVESEGAQQYKSAGGLKLRGTKLTSESGSITGDARGDIKFLQGEEADTKTGNRCQVKAEGISKASVYVLLKNADGAPVDEDGRVLSSGEKYIYRLEARDVGVCFRAQGTYCDNFGSKIEGPGLTYIQGNQGVEGDSHLEKETTTTSRRVRDHKKKCCGVSFVSGTEFETKETEEIKRHDACEYRGESIVVVSLNGQVQFVDAKFNSIKGPELYGNQGVRLGQKQIETSERIKSEVKASKSLIAKFVGQEKSTTQTKTDETKVLFNDFVANGVHKDGFVIDGGEASIADSGAQYHAIDPSDGVLRRRADNGIDSSARRVTKIVEIESWVLSHGTNDQAASMIFEALKGDPEALRHWALSQADLAEIVQLAKAENVEDFLISGLSTAYMANKILKDIDFNSPITASGLGASISGYLKSTLVNLLPSFEITETSTKTKIKIEYYVGGSTNLSHLELLTNAVDAQVNQTGFGLPAVVGSLQLKAHQAKFGGTTTETNQSESEKKGTLALGFNGVDASASQSERRARSVNQNHHELRVKHANIDVKELGLENISMHIEEGHVDAKKFTLTSQQNEASSSRQTGDVSVGIGWSGDARASGSISKQTSERRVLDQATTLTFDSVNGRIETVILENGSQYVDRQRLIDVAEVRGTQAENIEKRKLDKAGVSLGVSNVGLDVHSEGKSEKWNTRALYDGKEPSRIDGDVVRDQEDVVEKIAATAHNRGVRVPIDLPTNQKVESQVNSQDTNESDQELTRQETVEEACPEEQNRLVQNDSLSESQPELEAEEAKSEAQVQKSIKNTAEQIVSVTQVGQAESGIEAREFLQELIKGDSSEHDAEILATFNALESATSTGDTDPGQPTKAEVFKEQLDHLEKRFTCFTPETLVLTADGARMIGELNVRDLVWSWSHEQNKAVLAPIIARLSHEREIVLIKTSAGEFNLTADHALYSAKSSQDLLAEGSYRAVEELSGESHLLNLEGDSISLHAYGDRGELSEVIDIEVEGMRNFFVTTSDDPGEMYRQSILAHNCDNTEMMVGVIDGVAENGGEAFVDGVVSSAVASGAITVLSGVATGPVGVVLGPVVGVLRLAPKLHLAMKVASLGGDLMSEKGREKFADFVLKTGRDLNSMTDHQLGETIGEFVAVNSGLAVGGAVGCNMGKQIGLGATEVMKTIGPAASEKIKNATGKLAENLEAAQNCLTMQPAGANGANIAAMAGTGDHKGGLSVKGARENGLARVTGNSNSRARVDKGKYDYLFGKAKGRKNAAHNKPRTDQNAMQMKRLGVDDTPKGRQLLQEHFDKTVKSDSSITGTFKNEFGNYEVRESFFSGPSGKFSKFETTWEVMSDGTRRMTTVIPKEGK